MSENLFLFAQLHLRADADKTLEEMAPMATNESTYAPSDESYE